VDRHGTGGFPECQAPPAAAVPLQHPALQAELSCATDASDTHISGIMQKKFGDHWRPLGLFSRKLTDMESRYSAFDVYCWLHMQQSGIFAIFVKVALFYCGQITNCL
jgi:hypothetical protein